MEEKELDTKELTLCVFDNIQVINSLSDGYIPIDLNNRLEYTVDNTDKDTPREIYTDIDTGDELSKTRKEFNTKGFCKESVVIKTRVGKYEMEHFYSEFGCTAERYFFNEIEIDKEIFLEILKRQESLLE